MRHVANFFITGFLIWVFQLIGWVTINQNLAPFQTPFWNQILIAGIVGLIFTVGMWLLDLVVGLLVVGSCGLGCPLLIVKLAFIGPVGFWVVFQVIPGWVTMHATTVQIVIMGLMISLIRWHEARSSVPVSSSSTSSSSSK